MQYRLDGWGDPEDLEKRHRVQHLLDRALAGQRNGGCDGGEIGSGTMNVYLEEVVDPQRACGTIVRTLRAAGELEGAVVALDTDPAGEGDGLGYRVLWPEDFEEEFALWYVKPDAAAGSLRPEPAPCPFCGELLRTAAAKQCRHCRRDWHDPGHLRWLGDAPSHPDQAHPPQHP